MRIIRNKFYIFVLPTFRFIVQKLKYIGNIFGIPNKYLGPIGYGTLETLVEDKIEIYAPYKLKKTYIYTLDKIPEKLYETKETTSQYVGCVNNGTVFGGYGVVTGENKLVADVSVADCPYKNDPLLYQIYGGKEKKINGNIAIINSILSFQNYYHRLFFSLTKFHLLEVSKTKIDYYICYDELPFHKESLDILGIPREKRIYVPPYKGILKYPKKITANKIYFSNNNNYVLGDIDKYMVKFLRDKFVKKYTKRKNRRLYISRKGVRKLGNEEEVFDFLNKKYGFEFIECEKLSFSQQVDLFSQASIVVGSHGAGFSNVVFSSPGTILIELVHNYSLNPCFYKMSNAAGLKWGFVLGKEINNNETNKKNYDVLINIKKLDNLLKTLIH